MSKRLALVTLLIAVLTLIASAALVFSLTASWKKQRDLARELREITDANHILRKTLGELTVAITNKDKQIDRLLSSSCANPETEQPGSLPMPRSRRLGPLKPSNTGSPLANWVPTGTFSPSTSEGYVLHNGIPAIADLDGDHIPDIANSIKIGQTELGYSYRVDLTLSNRGDAISFTVSSDEPTGLNIEAIDVDGDHDLDLVITSHLLHRPVAVWLNDGKGRFTSGDLGRFSSAFGRAGSLVNPRIEQNPQIVAFERRRSNRVALKSNAVVVSPILAPCNTASRHSALLLSTFPGYAYLRGPPLPANQDELMSIAARRR